MAISSTRPAFDPAAATELEKPAAAMSQRAPGTGGDDGDEDISLRPAMHASTPAQGGATAAQVDARRFRANQGRSGQPTDGPQKIGWLQWLQFWAPSSSPALPAAVAEQVLRVSLVSAGLGIIIGLVLPRALYALAPQTATATLTNSKLWLSWGNSAVHRAADGRPSWREVLSLPQLHLYLLSWASFHLLEFLVTAKYNSTRLYDDSFILNNGLAYYVAHVFGLAEFVTEGFLLPARKELCLLNYVGVVLVLLGQTARSLAMIHASSNFSHAVAYRKRPDHELVTSGIYTLSRHPSYFGFFYWALGTQILLGNPIAACGYAAVLWTFFAKRIHGEEKYLVEFFGEEYIAYRKRVTTLIPFLR